jgi:hypothetical protein
MVNAVKGVHRACRKEVKQGNDTDRESVSSPTLHMLYFTANLDQSKCLRRKKPQIGAFYEGNSLDQIKAYLLQSLGCLQDLIHVARYLDAAPFFGQFAVDIE